MGRQLLVSPVVRLELLHDAKSADEFEALDHLLGFYDEVPMSARTFKTAIAAVRELAVYGRSPGFHRVGIGDALIAASAQERAVGVLHYNARDFDKLAVVLSFAKASW
jgi:predicted nucleic acid-binding protein